MSNREHAAESHALVGAVGRTSFEEHLKKGRVRLGRRADDRPSPWTAEERLEMDRAIDRHQKRIAKFERGRRRNRVYLGLWRTRVEIMRRIRALRFKPSALPLASALAAEKGLNKDALLGSLNLLRAANRTHASGALFHGELLHAIKAVQGNTLEDLHNFLHKRSSVFRTEDLLAPLGLKKTPSDYAVLTTALGMLELLDLAHKLPGDSESPYRWTHACHRFSTQTIPTWNLDWTILHALRSGSKSITHFSRPREAFGTILGSESGVGSHKAILQCFHRFEDAGLVRTQRIRGGGLSAHLTSKAFRWLALQDKTAYLLENLRKVLLRHSE